MQKINLAYRRKDDAIDGVLLVKTVDVRKSSNGGLYLDMTVMDATGEMNAKCWNWQENAAVPAVNAPVRVKALITEFNGKLQMRVDRIRAAREEEIEWSDLVPTRRAPRRRCTTNWSPAPAPWETRSSPAWPWPCSWKRRSSSSTGRPR